MQKITLYRYARADGGVTVSVEKPDTEYTELFRLVADEGYVLTDGTGITPCADTDDISAWSEIVDPDKPYVDPEDAAPADYQSALSEFGVKL